MFRKKIKYVGGGVGEKNKMWGSVKFSSPPSLRISNGIALINFVLFPENFVPENWCLDVMFQLCGMYDYIIHVITLYFSYDCV